MQWLGTQAIEIDQAVIIKKGGQAIDPHGGFAVTLNLFAITVFANGNRNNLAQCHAAFAIALKQIKPALLEIDPDQVLFPLGQLQDAPGQHGAIVVNGGTGAEGFGSMKIHGGR